VRLDIVFRAEAEEEFDEAFDWYDSQRVGLGAAFAEEVEKVITRVAANPLMHSVMLADIRKAVLRRFPYCVFYRPHPDRIEVIAVFHSSRDPALWQSRI
jgi:toxin ParE1/3/4